MNKKKQLLLWQITSVILLLSILLYMSTSIQARARLQNEVAGVWLVR